MEGGEDNTPGMANLCMEHISNHGWSKVQWKPEWHRKADSLASLEDPTKAVDDMAVFYLNILEDVFTYLH